METAAHGHSTLGIPKSVGEEFVSADRHDDAMARDYGDINPDMTDHEVAEALRDGRVASPQKFGDFWLFDVRITGTGAAYRDSLDEWALRDPAVWLTDDFVNRCAGLAVIWGHPELSGLNHDEFRERAIGSIVLPYRKDDEVRGVAKIFDADAAQLMQTTHRSTSPGVTPPKGSVPSELNDGTKVLDEGLPLILDHLAVCEAGVWDKDGPPDGIRLDATLRKDAPNVAETAEEKAALKKAEEERDDAKRRADALEAELADMKRADKARKDAEESDREALAKAEKEKADKAKKDAKRKDWETQRADESDEDYEKRADSRMDGESDEEWDERKKDRKAKKDAAAKQEAIDADRGMKEIKDSKTLAELQATIERQGRQLAALSQPPSLEDSEKVAKAWSRADAVFQMLGEATPQPMHGETPTRYRKRLANALRPFTDSWKSYTFHDSQQDQDFDAVENLIYAEATAHSKKVIADKPGFLRELKGKTALGRDQVSFIGDHRTAWMPFMPPTKRAFRFNREPHRAAASR